MPLLLSDDVNALVLDYLKKSGFFHSAFTFAIECGLDNSTKNGEVKIETDLVELLQGGVCLYELEKLAHQVKPLENNENLEAKISNSLAHNSLKEIQTLLSENSSIFDSDFNGFAKHGDIHKLIYKSHAMIPGLSNIPENVVSIKDSSINHIPTTFGLSNDFCWSFDSNNLIVAHSNGACVTWRLEEIEHPGGLSPKSWRSVSVFYSEKNFSQNIIRVIAIPSTHDVVFGDSTGNVEIYNQSSKNKVVYNDFKTPVWCISSYSSATLPITLYCSDVSGKFTLRSGDYFQNVKIFSHHTDCISDVSWSQNYLAISSIDGTISVINLETKEIQTTICPSKGDLYEMSWSPRNIYLACLSWDRSILIYENPLLTNHTEIKIHKHDICSLLWCEIDGEDLLITTDMGSNIYWHSYDSYFKKWNSQKTYLSAGIIACVAFVSQPSPFLILGCHFGYVILVNAKTREIMRTFLFPCDILNIKFNPSISTFAFRFSDGQICSVLLSEFLNLI